MVYLGSAIIGVFLGVLTGTAIIYYKEWKERKDLRENREEYLKKLNKEKKRQKTW